jgi:hypothetical protein
MQKAEFGMWNAEKGMLMNSIKSTQSTQIPPPKTSTGDTHIQAALKFPTKE